MLSEKVEYSDSCFKSKKVSSLKAFVPGYFINSSYWASFSIMLSSYTVTVVHPWSLQWIVVTSITYGNDQLNQNH